MELCNRSEPVDLRALKHKQNQEKLPDNEDFTSPLESYSQVQVLPKIRYHQTFGCPVYAVNLLADDC